MTFPSGVTPEPAAAGPLRWHVKKAARRLMAALSWASGWLLLRSRVGARPRVRVLTYHRVRDAARDPFSVTRAEFNRQMAWLAARHMAISLEELLAVLDGRRSLARDAVMVTIDDGYDDLASAAVPVLARHGIPAVAFIPAGEIGEGKRDTEEPHLSHREVAALGTGGIEVGSHAWDHRSLGRMTPDDALSQATASRHALEAVVGHAVTAFAYPFGTRLDFNEMTGRALRAAGYRCAFTSQHGAVTRASDLMELPRIKIEGGDPFWVFRLALRGGLDGWRLIDRLGCRFQSTPHQAGPGESTTRPSRRSTAVAVPDRPVR